MLRSLLIVLGLTLLACTTSNPDKIVVPELHAGFYSDAMVRINDELKSDPSNNRLVEQKLFYCDQLNWPTTCISALDTYKASHGMTNQLVEQYIAYYERHQRFDLLVELFQQWEHEFDLLDKYFYSYLDALVQSDEHASAKRLLRQYLVKNESVSDLIFACRQYLKMQDTTMAVYNLSKLNRLQPQSELSWDYGLLLVQLGYTELGFRILDQAYPYGEGIDRQLQYARLLERDDQNVKARELLKPLLVEGDTMSYLLSSWYRKELMWDSAGHVLTNLIAQDTTKSKPLWELGRLYEDRGWLTHSMSYFDRMLKIDPNDSLALKRIELIQRKIAYLQRLKFEESKVAPMELKRKEFTNE